MRLYGCRDYAMSGKSFPLCLAVVILAVIASCGVAPKSARLPEEVLKAIDSPSSLTLFSLQPWGGPDLPEWDFHGHHQNGHAVLEPTQAKQAVAALKDAVSRGTSGVVSMCLVNPRHALRAVSGGNTYDILICYECGQLELYKNDQPLPFAGSIAGNADALNRLLKKAGIPLADDANALQASYREEARLAVQRADAGDARAQELIGHYLISGRGITQDEEKGIRWLAKSSGMAVDDPVFEVKLGKLLEHSREWPPDYQRSLQLFQVAADAGNAEGQYQVGYLYEVGDGVAADHAEALQWFRKAADQGNPKAQYQLGVYFAKGWVVQQNYLDAMTWFSKAAEQGHPEAMRWIAALFKDGLGVKKDPGEATFWFQLARHYHTMSGEQMPAVTPEQQASANQRVAVWTAGHVACPDDCRF
jgi:TPR repeat protein